MTFAKYGFIAVPAAWLLIVTATPTAQEKTTNSGIFTAEHVKRGEATYKKECVSCHGDGLEGDGFAPGLSGSDFMSAWNGTSVGDLYDRIRISMPPSNPASVPAQSKADIIAFVLEHNKFPVGQAELTPDAAKTIKFELPK